MDAKRHDEHRTIGQDDDTHERPAYYCMACPLTFRNAETSNAHHAETGHHQHWKEELSYAARQRRKNEQAAPQSFGEITGIEEPHPTGEKSSASAPPAPSMFCPLCRETIDGDLTPDALEISGFTVHTRCAAGESAIMDLAELAYPTAVNRLRQMIHQSAFAYPVGAAFNAGGTMLAIPMSDGRVFVSTTGVEGWKTMPPLPGSIAEGVADLARDHE